jgi:CubicO group peptidase (beta-lactamase class C family)
VPFEQAQVEMERVVTPVAPAGAPWSNALDMGRYLIAELNQGISADGMRVVSSENLAITWEPQVPVDATAAYGLGWFVDNYKGQLMLHHGGNTFGFTSDLAFLPEAGIGISVLTNGRATNAFNDGVRFRLFELLFEQPLAYDAQADFENAQMREAISGIVADALPVEADAVAPFLGSYSNPALGTLALLWENESLFADTGEFRMEVRALPAEDGSDVSEYVIYAAPMTGLPLRLEIGGDAQPQVILGTGIDEYLFTWLE